MANDWIPAPDAAFDTKFNTFNLWVQANGTTHGCSAGQLTSLDDAHGVAKRATQRHMRQWLE